MATPASRQAFIVSSAALLARLEAYGVKMFIQISAGLGRNSPGSYGPSENPYFGTTDKMNPVLTTEQVREKIQMMVDAAKVVQQAGFPGVEIHAIHWGYLLDQMASSLTNRRTDEYGGDLRGRMRMCTQIVEGIKEACGDDFAVGVRLGLKSYAKGFNGGSIDGEGEAYRTLEEGVEICRILEEAGVDALDVDTGVYDSFYYACPPMYVKRGYMEELARAAKEAVGIPIVCGSRMGDIDCDERCIEEGAFDAIAIGRPMLADPDLPKKVSIGRPDKVRPCIACNQGCLLRLFQGLPSGCAMNPLIGRDADYEPKPALAQKFVVIVGGGVAGMEAARTCAMRGHKVTLFEKSDRLGGHLISGGAHDFKSEVRELNLWYQGELADWGVDVCMGVEATPELIDGLEPDAVILANGSSPIMPRIEGIDHPKALGCIDALLHEERVGQRVVVIGGGLVGCEISLDLINKGHDVTIVEALPQILSSGPLVPLPNAMYLLAAFVHHKTPVLTSTRISAVTDEGAVVDGPDGRRTLPADTVIIAVGFKPNPSMAPDLRGHGYEVTEIGDERSVGNILTAIWDAYEVARTV
jgi:2-enoate reductase